MQEFERLWKENSGDGKQGCEWYWRAALEWVLTQKIQSTEEVLIDETAIRKEIDQIEQHNPNPVRFEDGAWYWWDETWTDRTGPFDTREEADADCMRYCIECLGDD